MDFLEMVKESGIIGAGGAGFPTHAKLAAKADYILMNGAECEPLLRVDQQLMARYPKEIILGFEAAGRIVQAEKAIIGIKGKHRDVIEILEKTIEELKLSDYVSIGILPDIYPAGDEQVLVYELTGRVVPEAGIPIRVGCVVMNTETALNVYKAAAGTPVIEKYITIAGDVPDRKTVKVPVGMPILDVLKMSGIDDFSDYAVIGGGPMMGPVLKNIDGYVTKKDKGFVVLKKDHPLIRKKTVTKEQARRVNRATCEQCRMCTDMCPRFLLGHGTQPHLMMRALNCNLTDINTHTAAQLCCQCNLCNLFSCQVGLFPKDANNFFREELAAKKIKYQPTKEVFEPRAAREYRLVPSKRLVARIGLTEFDKPSPMTEEAVCPEIVHIALSQHVGAPAQPIVKVGDKVKKGQKIGAIPEGSLGAAVHASISGEVTACEDGYIVIRREENV